MKQVLLISLGVITLLGIFCFTKLDGDDKRITEDEYKKYVKVKLNSSFEKLKDWEKNVLPILVEAAKEMDKIFWMQSYGGNIDSLLNSAKSDNERQYLIYNYGPWDRLNGNLPFKNGFGEKPAGANFYPTDMNDGEFEAADLPDKKSLYTILRRDKDGKLMTIPYNVAYKREIIKAAELLRKAADLSEDEYFAQFLRARAKALESDEYIESDRMWLKMKDNSLDLIIGPIENYEDHLYGYKAANEAYVLVKDRQWSEKLNEIVSYLPGLQKDLPVNEEYKKESPGSNSQLAVF